MRPARIEDYRRPGAPRRAREAARERHRQGPRAVDDPLGTARRRQDDARQGHRRAHQVGLRAVLGGARRHPGAARDRRRGEGAARLPGRAHDRLRRRDPSLQQGAAGRVPAARRGRHHHAHRRDHGEPVVRGQRGAPLALQGVPARGARARTTLVAILERALADREHGLGGGDITRRRRGAFARSPGSRAATRAARSRSLEAAAEYARSRGQTSITTETLAAPPRRRRRSSTTRPARSTTTSSARSSSRCAAPIRTPPSTG